MTSLTLLATYLTVVLALAAISIGASLGVVAEAVVRNRRTRLYRRESVCAYYGRLSFHH